MAGAAPLERRNLETIVDTVRQNNITAETGSAQSRFLRNLTDQHLHFFTEEAAALLKEADFFGVDLPYVNAIPRTRKGRHQVIVFTGLLKTVQFYGELIQLLNLMLLQRPNATLNVDGYAESEALMFSSAAFAGLAGLVDRQQPLPKFRRLLGIHARKHAAIGYLFAVLFILAHEIGHLRLGHLYAAPELSERMPTSFAIPEELSRYQSHELEADEFAMRAFRERSRENIIPSVLFFLGPFAFLEAFARVSGDYPLSVNRAEHVRLLVADSEASRIAAEVLQSSVAGFHRLATMQGLGGTNLRDTIQERMPPRRAEWIIGQVAARIRAEHGSLESAE